MGIPSENQAFPSANIVRDDPWTTPDDIVAVHPVKA